MPDLWAYLSLLIYGLRHLTEHPVYIAVIVRVPCAIAAAALAYAEPSPVPGNEERLLLNTRQLIFEGRADPARATSVTIVRPLPPSLSRVSARECSAGRSLTRLEGGNRGKG